jgi:cytochrome c556
MRLSSRRLRRAAPIAVLACLAACAPTSRPQDAAKPPALHAVLDSRLRALMADINALMVAEKEMTAHQKDIERRDYARKMAADASAMGETVEAIAARLPALRLNPAEQANFLALADTLRKDAAALHGLAATGQADALPAQLQRIEATCRACHQLFRAGGG